MDFVGDLSENDASLMGLECRGKRFERRRIGREVERNARK